MSMHKVFTVFLLVCAAPGLAVADDAWEQFADGSSGRATEFRGDGRRPGLLPRE